MTSATELRRELHAYPELSGSESATAERVRRFFAPLEPDDTLTGLGGNGLAFCFGAAGLGPTVMLRCELDALPIAETNRFAHRSQAAGVSHKCGHDGHMAILAAVGKRLAAERPERGRVVLLYQPAEETGAGAAGVVADPSFDRIRPDRVYGLHNLPGYPLGQVVVRDGTFTCASRGMAVRLVGRTAHAAQPETGLSPAAAMCSIIADMQALGDRLGKGRELLFATVVGAKLGERAFGVAPGEAQVWATLRTETDAAMASLVRHCEQHARAVAAREGLHVDIAYEDVFAATVNSAVAVDTIRRACAGLPLVEASGPFRWSEDFGCFTKVAEGAFLALGAGQDLPALHNADYDFPDALIESGADVLLRVVTETFQEFAP